MFGCKIYLGEPDAEMFKRNPALSFVHDSPNIADALFEPDAVICDQDLIKFGGTEIKFYLVPGHTSGAIACFFDVNDGKETKRAGYFGGFGFNTLTQGYLKEIGDTKYQMRREYLASLEKVINEHVDIFLGNHTNNNKIIEKRKLQTQNPKVNPYVDPDEWRIYLTSRKKEVLTLIQSENEER